MKPLASEPRGVWRAYAPEALEREYNARATVSDVDALLRRYRQASDDARRQCPEVRTVAYGPHPDECLDVFPVPGVARAPVLVFVHGGYWRALGRQDSSFMAPMLRRQGVATVALHYSLAPAARLPDIVAQCRRSLLWLWQHGEAVGIDPERMVLAGSSAGAHLVAMMLADDWLRTTAGLAGAVRGAVLASGLYDLQPLRHCLPHQWLQLSEAEAEAMSPVSHLPRPDLALKVVVAEQDTGEFRRQSALYASLAAHCGCAVESLDIAGRNHFDVVLDWMDPATPLSRSTLALF